MRYRWAPRLVTPLLVVASVLFAAAELRGELILDPEPEYQEFGAEAAVNPGDGVLLTWTRQQEPGGAWSVMAATLDPDSGRLGELHEWGAGGVEQVVPLGSGYLALRLNVDPNPEWAVQRLDETGEPVGEALPLGFVIKTVAHATPDGGAVVVASGVSGTGGRTQAWRFGPDGALLAGPTPLVDVSIEAAVGADGAGNLVLVWSDQGGRVFSRRFSPDLQPLGPAVPVALGGGHGLHVAVAPDGRFVAVFSQPYQLKARAFNANGRPVGGRIQIAPRTDFVMAEDLDVAIGPDGKILVVWKTYENHSNVPTVRARVLSLAGRPLSPVTRLARIPGGRGDLLFPRVESLAAGDFLVLWTQADPDGERLTLRSQHFHR